MDLRLCQPPDDIYSFTLGNPDTYFNLRSSLDCHPAASLSHTFSDFYANSDLYDYSDTHENSHSHGYTNTN
jgi:hypothetical protein